MTGATEEFIEKTRTLYRENADNLPMFTLYQSPKDYPGKWVLRMWVCRSEPVALDHLLVTESEAECIAFIRNLGIGLAWLERRPEDDACIRGVWL